MSKTLSLQLPWVEKYRPQVLSDIVGNKETIDRLQQIAKDGNMPHMIISGMPGIGKTTSVHCLAHELLGRSYADGVLELNASDDRGIDVVRNQIKHFAQKKLHLPPGKHKIVILDEADSMTAGAQQALRRTMELYSNSTRFAFACNQSNKIIEPLQSRCAILRYSKLSDEDVLKRLLQIIKLEDVKYTNDGLEAIIFTAEGDMRQAINNLQSTVAGHGLVNADNVFKIVDSPHPLIVKKMLLASNLEDSIQILRTDLWKKGYSSIDIVTTSFRVTKNLAQVKESVRLEMMKEIGLTHMRILEGVGTYLQLASMLAKIHKLNNKA
ncbi:Rfc4p [Saccharomyces cerevisiae YJM1478]|nr:Rfc4p [Saccharomyces cerevisiae YJM1307]AJU10930.1 Rfc4p [Saccharomyces cerevisiae YJM1478]EGA56931.1 Rfc4p [Saccharomyces cerevisiae FostersB]KAF4005565.1 Replication factor C subunit 4 [Saccharomyces cerevisiae]CAI4927549.1 BTE_HP_G0226430.mRNA.1.CDS.1 [Saccharomyces cerevisiae]